MRARAPATAVRALRVLLTRAEEDCAAWAAELERRGIAAVSLPCIAAAAIDTAELRAALTEAAARTDWLVFTSRRGVEAFADLCGAADARIDARIEKARIAVVGAATAEAARRRLGRADLVGEGTAETLARSLAALIGSERHAAHDPQAHDPHDPQAHEPQAHEPQAHEPRAHKPRARVVAALAATARDTLERTLRDAGADCTRFDVYRTVAAAPARPKRSYAALGVDAALLASPSAVQGFANQVALDAAARLVTIGPSTSAAVRALGLEVAAEADSPSLEGMLAALETALGTAADA